MGKAILGPPKQDDRLVYLDTRGVSLKVGGEHSLSPLVHPQRDLATTEGFAPSASNPNSIPLPASHATILQLLQCYFEKTEIMLEALVKRFAPAAFCPHLKMTIFL